MAETLANSTSSKRHEEHQYLDLVREILDDGEHRPDRYETPSPSPSPTHDFNEDH